MTLQPIVENAVQHGLRPLGEGQISIGAAREGGDLSALSKGENYCAEQGCVPFLKDDYLCALVHAGPEED